MNVAIHIMNSTIVHIQWDPPPTPNGVITHYTVYIDDSLVISVSATSGTQSISISDFSPYQTLSVRLSASTMIGEGPLTISQSVTTHESGIYCLVIFNFSFAIHFYHSIYSFSS